MAIKSYVVISGLPVVVEEGGQSISYRPGAVFEASDRNPSVIRLLNIASITLATDVDPSSGFTIVEGPQGPPGVGAEVKRDKFFPILGGQTIFNLSSTPINPGAVTFYINGLAYTEDDGDIVVAGTVVTWTDAKFTIESDDSVWAQYEV